MAFNQVFNIEGNWYSWIPTNLGVLNFQYVADESNLQKVFGKKNYEIIYDDTNNTKIIHIKNTNLSDTNFFNKLRYWIEEPKDTAEITITKQSKEFKGNIKIIYNDKLEIRSSFNVKENGKTLIYNISVHYDSQQVTTLYPSDILHLTIAMANYTILKKVIHGDNHHEQKIDTFIGVYKDSFDPLQILNSFGESIKNREKIVKDTTQTSCFYIQKKITSAFEIKGYLAYLNTFKSLFFDSLSNMDQKEFTKKMDQITNVAKSLEASVNKIKFYNDIALKNITLIFTFIAFFISLNIFYNGLYKVDPHLITKENRILFSLWAFFGVLTLYLIISKQICISKFLAGSSALSIPQGRL